MNKILENAKTKYNFYETPKHHSQYIYNDYNPQGKLKVIDICCGLGSLVKPWYDNGHDITLVELNQDFIPILKQTCAKAKIESYDFLLNQQNNEYDVFLCNPPFNDINGKTIYPEFFCKILNQMINHSTLYFICPHTFYKNSELINLDIDNEYYFREHNKNSPIFYYSKYGFIELHSNEFRFNKQMIRRMIDRNIINDKFLIEYEKNKFTVDPFFEFRFLCNVSDFETTSCRCALFKVNK
jgi:hypothetical protein